MFCPVLFLKARRGKAALFRCVPGEACTQGASTWHCKGTDPGSSDAQKPLGVADETRQKTLLSKMNIVPKENVGTKIKRIKRLGHCNNSVGIAFSDKASRKGSLVPAWSLMAAGYHYE